LHRKKIIMIEKKEQNKNHSSYMPRRLKQHFYLSIRQ
jgi:hypothetical protein